MKKITVKNFFLICAFSMLMLDYFLPVKSLTGHPINFIGIMLLIAGIAMSVTVKHQFSKVDTEIHTFRPPRRLVTEGLFRFSRNPIYLGFSISLVGICVWLNSISPTFVVVGFILTTNYWYIPFEERAMEKTFGQAFLDYQKKVRRWI